MQTEGFRNLVRGAKGGSRTAADCLADVTRRYLRQIAAGDHRGDHADDPSDLAQLATLQAWQKIDQFQETEDDEETAAKYRGWLRQILFRLRLNRRRDAVRQRRSPDGGVVSLDAARSIAPQTAEPLANEVTAAAHAVAAEDASRVRVVIDRIPNTLAREIVRRRYYEEQSLRSIAGELGVEYDRTRQLCREAMIFIQSELQESGDADRSQ